MRLLLKLFAIIMMAGLAACAGPAPELPTEVPSPSPVPPTETAVPTRTPFPTPTATIAPPPTTATDPAQQAFVRFVHVATELGTVDFFVEDFNFARFMEPGSFTDPNGLVAGQYRLSVRPNGPANADTILAETSLVLLGGDSVLVIVSGGTANPTLSVIKEDLSPITGNRSRISVFNGLSSENITLNNGTTVLASDTAFGTASAVTTLDAGQFELNVRSGGQIVFASRYSLRARQTITFIPYTLTDLSQTRLLSITSQIYGIARVSVINTLTDFSIDMAGNEETLASNLLFRAGSDAIEVAARDYRIRIFTAGADRTSVEPVHESSLSLNADVLTYIVVVGTPDNVRLVTYTVNPAPVPPGTARLGLINTLSTFPRVRVASNVSLDEVVPYGNSISNLVVGAGPLPLNWTQDQPGDNQGTSLELRDDFAIVPGTDVLYLFTGLQGEPPLIFVNQVGEAVPTPDASQATATPSGAPILYAINTLDDLSIEFRISDVPLGSPLNARSSSFASLITSGEQAFTALRPDTSQLLARQITTVSPNTFNALTLVRRSDQTYELILFETPALANPNPTLRLINISEESIPLGMSIVVNNGNTFAFPDPNEPVDPETGVANFRISYPIGLTRLANAIGSLSASALLPVRLGGGTYDLYIVDDFDGTITNILPGITLEAGRHYDVIAFQLPGSRQVTAFVLPLPPRG